MVDADALENTLQELLDWYDPLEYLYLDSTILDISVQINYDELTFLSIIKTSQYILLALLAMHT